MQPVFEVIRFNYALPSREASIYTTPFFSDAQIAQQAANAATKSDEYFIVAFESVDEAP